jgi:hypothetical protein
MDTSSPSSRLANGSTPSPSPGTAPLSEDVPAVGDWAWLLSGDGVVQNTTPYLVRTIERGADGALYALFLDIDTGWPLAQCEKALPRRWRPH